jgi:phosphatidylglycerol---prolipoprotein diacylglyceryl transferase
LRRAFPNAGHNPRHPSQLYEALLEGFALFIALRWLTRAKSALHTPGYVAGSFLIGHGLARSVCELFREPDSTHALTFGVLTPGIAYSVPMVAPGLLIITVATRRGSHCSE